MPNKSDIKAMKRFIKQSFASTEQPNIQGLIEYSTRSGCLDIQDDQGRTLLMLAASKGTYSDVRVLIGGCADTSLTDKRGDRALEYSKRRDDGDNTIHLGLGLMTPDRVPTPSPSLCSTLCQRLTGMIRGAQVDSESR